MFCFCGAKVCCADLPIIGTNILHYIQINKRLAPLIRQKYINRCTILPLEFAASKQIIYLCVE